MAETVLAAVRTSPGTARPREFPCGTVAQIRGSPPLGIPVIMGHAYIGVVAAAGGKFLEREGVEVGDRIVSERTSTAATATGATSVSTATASGTTGAPIPRCTALRLHVSRRPWRLGRILLGTHICLGMTCSTRRRTPSPLSWQGITTPFSVSNGRRSRRWWGVTRRCRSRTWATHMRRRMLLLVSIMSKI